MPTGTVHIFDPLATIVQITPTRTTPNVLSGTQRTGVANLFAPLPTILQIAPIRRSPGDLGYANAPVVGGIIGRGIGRTQVAYQPGAAYKAEFTTNRIDTGNVANADATPTAMAVRNGADAGGANWVAVAFSELGVYKLSGTIPGSYVTGDSIQVRVDAVVNGIQQKLVVSDFQLGPVSLL